MIHMLQFIKKFFSKKRNIFFLILVIAGGIYAYLQFSKPAVQVKYVLGSAEKGMFIGSITGTGQVSGENQIDLKPKVSGAILSIAVKEGQTVKKNDVLMQLDTTDAQKTIRDASQAVHDAQNSLDSAKLSMTKAMAPANPSQILSTQNAVDEAKRALTTLQQGPNDYDLKQAQSQVTSAEQNNKLSTDGVTPLVIRNAYDNSVGTLQTTMQQIQDAMTDADQILGVDNKNGNIAYANLLSVLDITQKDNANAQYNVAKPFVSAAKLATDGLKPLNEDTTKIDASITAVQDAVEKMNQLLSSVMNALNATLTSSSFSQSSLDSLKSMIQSDRSNISAKQTALVSMLQSLNQAKTTYANSGIQLQQAQLSLQKLTQPPDAKDVQNAQDKINVAEQQLTELKAGALPIDIQINQNSIAQRQSSLTAAINKLNDARQTLNDYTIKAPFDGIIAKLPVHVADDASAGTAVATIIDKQQIVDTTLNEVDIAKVKAGQKVTMTFDAIDGLTMTGQVIEVGTLGTVTQGVVNYDVKIGMDTQDDRVKQGMSASAAIIIETDPDVILVPNSAVKTQGNQQYVEIMDKQTITSSATDTTGYVTGTPRRQIVTTGSANDTDTIILTGLNEGDQIVTQTIQPTTTKTTTTATTGAGAVRIPGLTGGGGGSRGPGG